VSVIDEAVRSANEPARRFRLIWNLFGAGLCGIFAIIGSGYLVGGRKATASHTLQLLENLESPIGGLHTHGLIMLAMALFLAYGLGPHYRRSTRIALIAITFYSLTVATMVFGGWALYSVSFAAPWWYVYTAFNAMTLLILAPSVLSHPAPIVGLDPGVGAGGEGV
jgi:hypothetical protein